MMGSSFKGVGLGLVIVMFVLLLLTKTDIGLFGIIGFLVGGLALALYVGLRGSD